MRVLGICGAATLAYGVALSAMATSMSHRVKVSPLPSRTVTEF